ncbi:S-layer homology domain-containing protein [Candidatus Peregrinibacteria bacterium]|nr:S-layer homology domain-containing protein [Candidatus Peregrinibacteria bacterium]
MNLTQNLNCPIEYNDIPRDHYAYDAACTFRNRGWTDSLTTLEPNEPVTRAETASLLNRVIGGPLLSAKDLRLGKVIAEGQVFSDVTLSNQFFVDTAVVRSLGIMKGNPDKTFGLDTTLNRAEAATIFFRLMDKIEESEMRSI